MRLYLINIFVLGILLVSIYSPKVLILGYSLDTRYIYVLFIFLCLVYRCKFPKSNLYIFLLCFVFFICVSYFYNIIFDTLNIYDTRGIYLCISLIIMLLSSRLVANYLLSQNLRNLDFKIYNVLTFNCYLIIFLFISDTFRNYFYNIIDVNPNVFQYIIKRYSGIVYDGFSYISVFNSIIYIYGLLIITYTKLNGFKFIIISISQLVVIFSIFLTGRAGFITLLIGLFIMIIPYLKTKRNLNKLLLYKYILIQISIISITTILIINSELAWRLDYYFNFFKSFIFEKSLRGDSSTRGILDNHFVFILENFWSIFFGIADYTNTLQARYASDLGFICLIHGGGLAAFISFILIILYLIYFGLKTLNENLVNSMVLIHMSISLLIVNFKDFYVFFPSYFYFLLFLIFFIIQNNKIYYRLK